MSHQDGAGRGEDARLLDRLVFFSDAVFAIVLTLLVLELRPPGAHDEAGLAQGLVDMVTHFASFAISFTLGGIFWMAHLRNARLLKQFDWLAAGANLLHLMAVALLPFASAILGEHITSVVAFSAYAWVIVLVSFTGALFWLVSTRGKGKLVGGMSARQRIAGAVRAGAVGLAFCIGLLLIEIGQVGIARFCFVLLFVFLAIAGLIAGKQPKAAA